MVQFRFRGSPDPVTTVTLAVGQTREILITGVGGGESSLDVTVDGPSLVRVDNFFPTYGLPDANTVSRQLTGLQPGCTTLTVRQGVGGPILARGAIDVNPAGVGDQAADRLFYHGTSLEQAKKLMTTDLSPMAVPDFKLLEWFEYTDFGKGFYTHPEESKKKAVEWAKRKNPTWGVVRFRLTKDEFDNIPGTRLRFNDKKTHRPPNAPALFDSNPANWIEFVEYNRGIRTAALRPGDKDWSADYPWMRGPIWAPGDSGLPGKSPFPDDLHQINWGRSGLAALNTEAAKKRRFLFDDRNESLL